MFEKEELISSNNNIIWFLACHLGCRESVLKNLSNSEGHAILLSKSKDSAYPYYIFYNRYNICETVIKRFEDLESAEKYFFTLATKLGAVNLELEANLAMESS